MPIPDFIVALRRKIGHDQFWLPGVTAVVRRELAGRSEVLLVQRADNGAWTPVTGIPEPGEEAASTAVRECLEETGCTVRVDRLAATSVVRDVVCANGDRVAFMDQTFACTWLSGDAHVADDESVEVGWFGLDQLPAMSEHMIARIEAATSDETAARFGDASVAVPSVAGPSVAGPRLTPDGVVLGVDACEGGWVGVRLGPDGRPTVHVAAQIGQLVELVAETAVVDVVAIDIPIGLPDSAQAYALRTKILEVDAWVRSVPAPTVVEVHSEASFARMTGAPITARKHDAEGVRLRREALRAAGIAVPAWYRGAGFAEDDLLDACAAVWSAARHLAGESESMPVEPEVFGDQIPAAIWV